MALRPAEGPPEGRFQFLPGSSPAKTRPGRPFYRPEALLRNIEYKVSFVGGKVPLDLRFRGPLEAKSFVRGLDIDPPGAPGRVFDL